MKYLLFMSILLAGATINAQNVLNIEGQIYNNSAADWMGVSIPRSEPTQLTFRNNSITSVNVRNYLLEAGDEGVTPNNNHLDSAIITGNKFTWNGQYSPQIITHGLFAGYNINTTIKYNYLENVPYGIIYKSGTDAGVNMTFTSGGCAYNIVKNGKFAVRIKGINGVRVHNNTFYSGDGQGWYLMLITANRDRQVPAPSKGTKVFNNIFYSTIQIPMIKMESGSFDGFECDYNVYWCTAGQPQFKVDDKTLTWTQWRALGYDAHSVVINPEFRDFINFVPSKLNYGKNLGPEWTSGLSVTSGWVAGSSPVTSEQTARWQVGAVLHELPDTIPEVVVVPEFLNSVIEEEAPNTIEVNYHLPLATDSIPETSAFDIKINLVPVDVSSVSVAGSKVFLHLDNPVAYGDIVLLTYSCTSETKLQGVTGGKAACFIGYPVDNNLQNTSYVFPDSTDIHIFPNPASNFINVAVQHEDLNNKILRIIDHSGRLCMELNLETGKRHFQIPLNLTSGIYIIQLILGKVSASRMLLISN